jgi:hypothetical protein
MYFDPVYRQLSGTPPPGSVGQNFHVVFHVTTPSGGTDVVIAIITIAPLVGLQSGNEVATLAAIQAATIQAENPNRGHFVASVPSVPASKVGSCCLI